jgi:anti-sigma factor RsiW
MTVWARPSVRCRKLLLEISRYLDGDLTPARHRMVEQHVRACACCGTMAARLRSTVAACRAEGSRRPPRDVMSRAEVRIRALIAQSGPRDIPTPQRRRHAGKATSRQSASAKR